MTPYLDGGFLLSLLAKVPGTPLAARFLRAIETPVSINFLHQLQAENMLLRFQSNESPPLRIGGNAGLKLWRQYLDEGVFTLAETDWDTAFRNAIAWNRLGAGIPPSPWLFLHPALALSSGATAFYSFDPRARAMARTHRMKLFPERL